MIGYKEAKIRIMSVSLLFKPVASSKLQVTKKLPYDIRESSKKQETRSKRKEEQQICDFFISDL
jgi:hypothetical protein